MHVNWLLSIDHALEEIVKMDAKLKQLVIDEVSFVVFLY